MSPSQSTPTGILMIFHDAVYIKHEFARDAIHMSSPSQSTPTHIRMIFHDAVDIKHEFVRDAIPVRLLGMMSMNSGLMCQYIEFYATIILWSPFNNLTFMGCNQPASLGSQFPSKK
jgi:hypothetical protein